jgi:hypothetical protein
MTHVNKVIAQNIPMTFHNGSLSSIYLSIPSVMNPSLNPMSDSVVSLDVGQNVYFFPNGKRGKKELLFTVNTNWKKDTILQIDEIVKIREKELSKK